MDGYALRAVDVRAEGSVLPVSQRIPAGVVGEPLVAGTAARIFTGAQVPAGADTVVMQELCETVDGGVRVNTMPQAGTSVRRRGEDVQDGSVVLAAGLRLAPQHLGLAAAVGAATLLVGPAASRRALLDRRRARDAGRAAQARRDLQLEPLHAHGPDPRARRRLRRSGHRARPARRDAAALREAAVGNDLIVTCGGVSVGEEDHLRPAVEAEGRIDLWQIALKPGKPLAFGEVRRPDGSNAWFIGLPGNPVSSYITFLLAVRPVLLRLQGAGDLAPAGYEQRADFDWPRPDKRREFLRVRHNAAGGLDLFPNQGSGVLTSVVWADGLVDNPARSDDRAR